LSAPVSLPLSVVIVAKNEAANLPRCLASVRGWTAGVVVALNATTDASEALALAAGAQVHHLPWQGFRDTKNAALALATQPWALCLDADEEVSPALRAELIAFFARPDHATFAGARFPRKVWFLGRWITHGDWYHHSFPTLSSHVAKINPFADLFLQQHQARGTRFSVAAAVARPLWRFVRAYVFKLGFLDGFPGFYIAWATAFGAFVRYSRLYEAEHQSPPSDG
jgi:glycosyltransferase involved in cell wall biosynthesis